MATEPTEPPERTTLPPKIDDRFEEPLRGVDVDPETRCAHYDGRVDVIALRCAACLAYYPCAACHDAVCSHPLEPWPRERVDDPAVLCGVCDRTITALAYLDGDDRCPHCGAAFNPGCRAHRDRYFER